MNLLILLTVSPPRAMPCCIYKIKKTYYRDQIRIDLILETVGNWAGRELESLHSRVYPQTVSYYSLFLEILEIDTDRIPGCIYG